MPQVLSGWRAVAAPDLPVDVPANVQRVRWGLVRSTLEGMIRTLATLAVAALILTGCSGAPAALDTRATCDRVAPIVKEFGQVKPDAARFATYVPKVQAVVDKADEQARKTFAPMVDTMTAGAKGEQVVFKLAGVNMGIQSVCKGAGSTAW